MHRRADLIVLFEDGDRPTGRSQTARGRHPAGAATDDRHIEHVRHDYTSPSVAVNLRPRSSHRPRAVIQNDCRISRRSRQKPAFR